MSSDETADGKSVSSKSILFGHRIQSNIITKIRKNKIIIIRLDNLKPIPGLIFAMIRVFVDFVNPEASNALSILTVVGLIAAIELYLECFLFFLNLHEVGDNSRSFLASSMKFQSVEADGLNTHDGGSLKIEIDFEMLADDDII